MSDIVAVTVTIAPAPQVAAVDVTVIPQGPPGPPGRPGSDASVTKNSVEAVLTGEITTHTHPDPVALIIAMAVAL